MLNVYLKREDIPQTVEIIDNNDIVFDYDLYNNLKVDTNVQKIMKVIDGAEYIQGLDMRSKFGNITSMENLSTGCKTMINILHHPNAVINCIECGDNVLHKILHMNVGNVLLPLLPSNSEDLINVSIKTNKGSLTIDSQKFKECKTEDELKETLHEYYEILKGHDPKGRKKAIKEMYTAQFTKDFEVAKKDFFEKQAQAILDDADTQAVAIIEDAEAQAQDIKLAATKVSQLAKRKDEVATETLAKARQEKDQMLKDAQDEIFSEVFQNKYQAEFEQKLSSKEYRGQIMANYLKEEFDKMIFVRDGAGRATGLTKMGVQAFRVALGDIPKTDPIYGEMMSIDEKISSIGKIEINEVIKIVECLIKDMYDKGASYSDISMLHRGLNAEGLVSRGINEIINGPDESRGFERF